MASRVQVRVEQLENGRWHAFCREPGCTWVQTPSEKTYVNYRARSHRAHHRSEASRPCAATARIGDQQVTCWRLKDHEGKHCGNTPDEAGRFTTNRHEWSDGGQ